MSLSWDRLNKVTKDTDTQNQTTSDWHYSSVTTLQSNNSLTFAFASLTDILVCQSLKKLSVCYLLCNLLTVPELCRTIYKKEDELSIIPIYVNSTENPKDLQSNILILLCCYCLCSGSQVTVSFYLSHASKYKLLSVAWIALKVVNAFFSSGQQWQLRSPAL